MNLNKKEIIEEINKGSEVGKQIFEIELNYYRDLVRDNSQNMEARRNA